MDHLLSALKYQERKWLICEDLKVARLVLELQVGYTKYPCFFVSGPAGQTTNIISNKIGR